MAFYVQSSISIYGNVNKIFAPRLEVLFTFLIKALYYANYISFNSDKTSLCFIPAINMLSSFSFSSISSKLIIGDS